MARLSRSVASGVIVGATLLGSAWASTGLTPPPLPAPEIDLADTNTPPYPAPTITGGLDTILASDVTAPNGDRLAAGFEVGASTVSLAPMPEAYGGTWQTEGCTSIDNAELDVDHAVPSIDDVKGWPAASPDCIYLGGFGIGPARPAERVGHGGTWIRSIAISNGADTFVYQIADVVGWFARYDASVCSDCGILDVRETIADQLGIELDHIIIGSTHTHAGADTYGGWGGIPDWYRTQLRESAIAGAKAAVAALEPATVEVGEVHLRDNNSQRRDTYFSTTDTGATWLQARDDDGVIATWATYAGHPTGVGEPILHADWPGAAARWFEATQGGVGLVFEGGLGNVSMGGGDDALLGTDTFQTGDERGAESRGRAFAADVAADIEDGGTLLDTNDMAASVEVFAHPAETNPGLTTLASAGLFDREFTPGTKGAGLPGVYDHTTGAQGRRCQSAGPTVITTAGAHRIGDFAVAFGPGELFSNLAEVVKEEADRSAVTMVLAQTNDALGYIIQSFEFDTAANAGTHYGTAGHGAEYEEVFSIDRCIGDHVLDVLLRTTADLGF